MSALPQWRNASSTWIVSTVAGGRPSVNRARSSSSSRISAVPFTRNVSSMPGTRKSSPIPGVLTRLDIVSSRLFPGRSGIRSVRSSATVTKPGSPPRGVASAVPSGFVEATTTNGECAMKFRQCSSRWSSSLRRERSFGSL